MTRKVLCVIWALLAVFCILYGIIVKSAGAGTLFYAVWLALGVLFIILLIGNRLKWWKKLPLVLRGILFTFFIAALTVTCVMSSLVTGSFGEKGKKGLDYIIVLGAQVYDNGPSPVLKFRLDAAAEYLEENPDTVCIVTGYKGHNESISEAEGMADYLYGLGIDDERVILEDKAENTVENIKYSMELADLKNSSVGIVTNDFHMYRALKIAEKQGISDLYGISAKSNRVFIPNNVLREILAIFKEMIHGNI